MRRCLALLMLLACAALAHAADAPNVAPDPALEARVNALAAKAERPTHRPLGEATP